MVADVYIQHVIDFLSGTSIYSMEMQALWMAIQGAIFVRAGPNKNNELHWFHAFTLSVLVGFAGGFFGFVWLGKPSSMLSNDMNMAGCILAFTLVNYTPFDIGYMILNTLPFAVVTVVWSQLFRARGLVGFVTACFAEFKNTPSPYYPIPIFGPIIYATVRASLFYIRQ